MAQEKNKQETASGIKEPLSVNVGVASAPNHTQKQTCSRLYRYIIPALAVLFLFANIGLFAYLQFITKQQNPTLVSKEAPFLSPTPTPTPTPYPLPQGKKSFSFSYGKGSTGPKFEKVSVDPYDPKIGQPQTFSIVAYDTSPVFSVDLALYTDNKVASYSLTRVSGTETKGTWQVELTTDDTHYYHYNPSFIVKSANGENHADMTLRAY